MRNYSFKMVKRIVRCKNPVRNSPSPPFQHAGTKVKNDSVHYSLIPRLLEPVRVEKHLSTS